MGRPVCAKNHKYSILVPQIKDIQVCIMLETVTHLCQLTSLMVSCLLLLSWCTAISTSYWISSTNSNSQQQSTTRFVAISLAVISTCRPNKHHVTQNLLQHIRIYKYLYYTNNLMIIYVTRFTKTQHNGAY